MIFLPFLILAIFLESSIITLPITLSIILFAAVVLKKNEIFLLASAAGLILDILTFRTIGLSSLLFVLFIFLIFLYQKKFEIETLYFVVLFSFIGSFGYLFLTGIMNPLAQSFVTTIIVSLSFSAFKISNRMNLKKV